MPKYHPDQESQYDAGFGKTYNPEPAPIARSVDGVEYHGCTGCAFRTNGAACTTAPACNADQRIDQRDIIWVAA